MIECSDSIEYAFKSINYVDISTLLIVSDWRNSLTTASIAVAFTDTDPAELSLRQLYLLPWELDSTDMTKIYDFSAAKHKANYLVLRYECSAVPCKQARIHQIVCYQEQLVGQDQIFQGGPTSKSCISIQFFQVIYFGYCFAFLISHHFVQAITICKTVGVRVKIIIQEWSYS